MPASFSGMANAGANVIDSTGDPRSGRGLIDASARFFSLVIVLAILHLPALFDGTVLDDHWHQRGLREHGWSFDELLRTLNIAPADFITLWWQTRSVAWDYFRPVFILCMKFFYLVIGQGDPFALHAFSVGLHFVSALLIWRLGWRLTASRTWSWIAAMVFLIYPHSIITVAWPSSQNVVIQTTLVLAAMLAYLRASGLQAGPNSQPGGRPDRPSLPFLGLTFLFWILALFTRENALLVPAILGAFDLAFGGWKHVRGRWTVYLCFAAVAIAFFAWRESLQVHPLPDVYCRRPNQDWGEYFPWLAAKLLHYACASIWLAPMTAGPTGRFNPWLEAPGDSALMLVIVVGILAGYWRVTRGVHGWWIWPMWIVLFIVPVTAVIATPHSGYMSGVGLSLGLCVAGAAADRSGGFPRRVATYASISMLILGNAFMSGVNRLQWEGIKAAERLVPGWIKIDPPDSQVRDLFMINLPFVNIYLKPNLVSELGSRMDAVNVHALTFAPHPLLMDRPAILNKIDERTFTISVQGQAYFSRLLGRFLIDGFRHEGRLNEGETIGGEEFDVRVLEADEAGVWKLQFRFHRPLSDPRYCFYFVSAECGAARVDFTEVSPPPDTRQQQIRDIAELEQILGQVRGGNAAAALPLFDLIAAQGSANGLIVNRTEATIEHEGTRLSYVPAITSGPHRFDNYGLPPGRLEFRPPVIEIGVIAAEEFMPICRFMARALGSPHQGILEEERISLEHWDELRLWWGKHVTDRALRKLHQRRGDFVDLIWLRSEIDWDRHVSSVAIRSDMYLTGSPFPGPRD